MRVKYKRIESVLCATLLVVVVFAGSSAVRVSAADCSEQALAACSQEQCKANGGEWGYQGSTQTCHEAAADGTSTAGGTKDTNAQPIDTDATDPAASGGKCATLTNCDLVKNYLNPAIQLVSAMVGIAITISIVIGGIQYGSSAGDPQAVAAAKARIRNAIIALLSFLFLYALLNFLIPGGLFHG